MTDRRLIEAFVCARRAHDQAVLEGFHCVKHALRFGATVRQCVTNDCAALTKLAHNLAPDISEALLGLTRTIDHTTFDQLTTRPPGSPVVAIADRPPLDLTADIQNDCPLILLETPRNLSNVGAVIRVAAAAGLSGVMTTGELDPWRPDALRGAAGLHFAIPVIKTNLNDIPNRHLVAVDPEGETSDSFNVGSSIVAFGSERRGLSDQLLRQADQQISIPMQDGISSLNLACSVAVVAFGWRLAQL